jgi:hypothetical protein
MTLEYERLGPELQQMAVAAARLRAVQAERAAQLRQVLARRASDWEAIEAGLARAQAEHGADPKFFRAARPLGRDEPLDQPISAPPPPPRATLIATDGSQILPDRHAAFLYYLINIGAIIYYHGEPTTPNVVSLPSIFYPTIEDDLTDDAPGFDKSEVTIARDRREIETLAALALSAQGSASRTLAILDQRLLYWPFVGEREKTEEAVFAWTAAMTQIYETGALLAGYIDRPGKASVVTLLQTLLEDPTVNLRELGRRPGPGELTDADLYATLLGPGQRSPVFVDVSPANSRFAEEHPLIEVCFFYLNPGSRGQGPDSREEETWGLEASTPDGSSPGPWNLEPGTSSPEPGPYALDLGPHPPAPRAARAIARVDIPRWVAEDPAAVAFVHGLIYDQCKLMGDYPYVLARADELAVVGRHDEMNLNLMIDSHMQRLGVPDSLSAAKAGSKDIARAGRTRHEFRPGI